MPTYYQYNPVYKDWVGITTEQPVDGDYTELIPVSVAAGSTQTWGGSAWSTTTDYRDTYYYTSGTSIGSSISWSSPVEPPTIATTTTPPSISTAGYTYSWSGTAWSVVPKATLPEGDEVMSLGASGNAYKDLFVSEGTVYLGVHTLSVASNKLSYDGEQVVTGVGGTFETDFAHLSQAEIGLATITTLKDDGSGEIDLDTNLLPTHNRTFDLGSSQKSWNKVFVKSGPKAIEFEGTGVGIGYSLGRLVFDGKRVFTGGGSIGTANNLHNVYATGIVSAGGTVQAGIVTADWMYGGFIGTFYNTTGNPILRSADESFGGTVYGDIISNATTGFSTFHDIWVSGMATVGIVTAEWMYGGFIGTIYNTTGNPILRSADESFGGTVYGNVFSNLTTGISSFHDLTASGVITATEFHGDGSNLTNVASSDQLETTSTSDNATRYVTFVPNNSTGSDQTFYTNTDLKYNPSTGNLTVGGDVLTASVRTSTLYPVGGGTVAIAATMNPASDATHDLGSASNQWKDLHLSGNASIGSSVTAAEFYGDGTGLDLPVNSTSGSIAMKYRSSSTTTMADPGDGKWRLNNLNQATATQMAVDVKTVGGYNINSILSQVSKGTKIFLQRKDHPDAYFTFIVKAAPTLQGNTTDGWYLFSDIQNISSGGVGIADNKDCVLAFKGPNQINGEHVTPDSIDTVGIVSASGFSVDDDEQISIGSSDDLLIYHDGDHTYIDDQGQGNLKLRTNNLRVTNSAETKTTAAFIGGGACELYHDNALKVETTSTGINVTGVVTASSLSTGNEAMTFDVVGSNLIVTVAGIGSTTLALS